MDEIDIQIMKLLEGNGRLTHEEISRVLHISRPSVHQRVAKLEKCGAIRGYRAIIDWGRMGEKIKAIIMVRIKCNDFSALVRNILALSIPEVTVSEVQRIAGEWCIMLKVRVCDPRHITYLIDEMVKLPEVQGTSTTFILNSILEDGITAEEYLSTDACEQTVI